MQLSSDKVLTAFLGASIALVLKATYDWYIEYKRRRDIREMIIIDLDLQKHFYLQLADHCEKLVREIKREIEIFPIPYTNLVNTNVFKAFTPRDYFRIFSKDYYQKLMSIYSLIESHSTQLIRTDYDEYIEDLTSCKEEEHQIIDKKYIIHFSDLSKRYTNMAQKIDKELLTYKAS